MDYPAKGFRLSVDEETIAQTSALVGQLAADLRLKEIAHNFVVRRNGGTMVLIC